MEVEQKDNLNIEGETCHVQCSVKHVRKLPFYPKIKLISFCAILVMEFTNMKSMIDHNFSL